MRTHARVPGSMIVIALAAFVLACGGNAAPATPDPTGAVTAPPTAGPPGDSPAPAAGLCGLVPAAAVAEAVGQSVGDGVPNSSMFG